MAKKYYWLKLKNNFFLQPKIRKLRSLENGADLTIIYLKLQLLSIENDGIIYLEGLEDDMETELELLIEEDKGLIKTALDFLQKYKLLEVASNDELHLTEARQAIGSETSKAEPMRKLRQKRKDETLQNREEITNDSNNVTESYQELPNVEKSLHRDRDRDRDREDKEQEKREESERKSAALAVTRTTPTFPLSDYQKKFFEFYDAYPNHEYKDQALNYWLSQRYEADTIELILFAAKEYAQEDFDKYNKAKTPLYFLRDEKYKDYAKAYKEKQDRIREHKEQMEWLKSQGIGVDKINQEPESNHEYYDITENDIKF